MTHVSILFQDESLRLTKSHFVQLLPLCAETRTLSIFNIYPLHSSRIVRYNSGIGGRSENSHFAQDNSGIAPILTLRRTYTYLENIFRILVLKQAKFTWKSDVSFLGQYIYTYNQLAWYDPVELLNHNYQMSRDMTKPTKWLCAQRRLRSACLIRVFAVRLMGS